jgi:lysozyme
MADDQSAWRKLPSAVRIAIGSGAGAAAILGSFLDTREGMSLRAYQDGVQVWTACRGVTRAHGKPIAKGQVFSKAECDELDEGELFKALDAVKRNVVPEVFVTFTDPALAGIASFGPYNIGEPKWKASTQLNLLNKGPAFRVAACGQIRLWIKDGGRDCRVRANNCLGQVERREQEEVLCLHGVTWGQS